MNSVYELVDKVRNDFKSYDDIRDKDLKTPSDVVRFDNILYGDNKDMQILDLYKPADKADVLLPVIVSVHGGAWVYGDKERYQYYCMDLAVRGFAVINFTYRLAPEYKFPAQIEDINLVFNWLIDNANVYKLDINNIFAVGDSAGAHQLGLYANICTNDTYAKRYTFKVPESLKFKGLGLNCGQYKMALDKDNPGLTENLMKAYLQNGGDSEELSLIDVTKHITSNFPPSFIMTCTGDFLKMQAPLLVNKLIECNVPHESHFYGDMNKELGHVFHLNIRDADAIKFNEEQCTYFKSLIYHAPTLQYPKYPL